MVKGISKQVIVVRAPDPRFFEQAIFIVRDAALERGGVSEEEILKEADRVANGYVRDHLRRERPRHLAALCYSAVGALCVGLVWLATAVIF